MGKYTFDPNHLRWENPFNLGHSFCWQPTYRMWKQDTRSLCLRALVLTGKWLRLPWWSHWLCCVWRVRFPCPSPYLLALAFFLSPSLQCSLNLKESRDLVRVEPSSVIYSQFLRQREFALTTIYCKWRPLWLRLRVTLTYSVLGFQPSVSRMLNSCSTSTAASHPTDVPIY